MPVHIPPVIPIQSQNRNQNFPVISVTNPDLIANHGYAIPQDFRNIQISNPILYHPQQQGPIQPNAQQQTPIQSYYGQLAIQQNMPQIPAQPHIAYNVAQSPNQFNIYQ